MAKVLAQSTIVPALVTSRSHGSSKESGKSRRSAKMMCSVQTSGLRIRSFSGLRGLNSLDNMVRFGQDFRSKVAISVSSRQRRASRCVPKAMFERFTEKAIKVIMLAQEEARRLGHNFVGTEQILLGLIGEGTGIAAKVLKSMGINLKDARVEVEKIIGRGSGFVAVEIPFTPRAKRVLELSLEEARQLGHNYIGSEHLLLGLLREGEGVAARVLENLGADPSNIRTQVIRMVGEGNEVSVVPGGSTGNTKMPTLEEYGTNLTKLAEELPEEARELEKELRQITKSKNEAVRSQDFEKAGELRDREIELRAQITAIQEKDKEMNKAEAEAGDGGPVVTEVDIQHIVSSWTGIPVEKVSTDESDRLLKMEETLHKRVIGQDEAVIAISRAIRRARVGLKNPNRPIASFIFSGPTGVGKSELAKALAAYYFGSEEAMIRLDMSEFMERHTVSKLIGSPPGYVGYTEGGQLTEAVRRRPYTVVLFDEIEKAHPDVFNMMLQILEDGRLTDSKGRTVDFKNTLLIMTSNVGSSVIEKGGRRIGFDLDYDEKDSSYNRIKSLVTEELKQYFRPEFLNRLDEMIVFRQLTKLEVKEIADIMLKEVYDRLKGKDIELQVTERFRERVVDEGYNPSYGARPLRRAIMRLLEDSMAEKMLAREIKEGDSVIVDVDSDGNVTVLNGSSGAPESLADPIPVV
ncbi:Chaperonin ClpA/B [Corchorus capsularis]|uniref:Chaperonin ClpA/B n=1 Tax=Corchorus capsularis TaxID=210143 RepID=A0A1R3JIV7_COCAP|nr:Chaperonin ClpA/B [Corchorus capsularis]